MTQDPRETPDDQSPDESGDDAPEAAPPDQTPDDTSWRPSLNPSGEARGGGRVDPPASPTGPQDPFGGLLSGLGALGGGPGGLPFDPSQLGALMGQLQQMLAGGGDGSPVNWTLAHDLARQAAAAGGDPSPSGADNRAVVEAVRLADLWLDGACALPAAAGPVRAWSRAQWVEATMPTWRRLVEPVATSVAAAMADAVSGQADAVSGQAPAELASMMAGAGQIVRQLGGAVFGMQLGQAVGGLATEVVSAGETGLPLAPAGTVALLPANVAAFGEGLGVPAQEVRLYLALREAAHARLVAHVPWLAPHLLGAVEAYARGIRIDTDQIERAVRELDPTDPAAMQQALSSGMFEPQRTPAQQAALDRLETALALVEGWVDVVVDAAAATLPHAAALRETVRRRRAAGGPAEQAFSALVGLELRPRRLRDAAKLWERLTQARGTQGRDAVWSHPDLAPTSADLDNPDGFVHPMVTDEDAASEDDVDAALRAMLDRDPDRDPDPDRDKE